MKQVVAKRNQISSKKLFIMLATELFALTSLILPAVLIGFAGKNGMPVLLGASGVFLLQVLFYLSMPGIEEIRLDLAVKQMSSRPIASVISLLYQLRFYIHGLFLMFNFVSLIREVLLPEMNRFFILLPMAGITYLTVEKSLETRGRILEVLFPYIFLPLLTVLLMALFQLDYKSLPEQLWGTYAAADMKQNAYGIYGTLMFYQPVEFILFLLPSCCAAEKEPVKIKRKAVCGACLFAIGINLFVYLVTVGMFGTTRTGEKLWSALYIMQSVRLPGRFVERLDILFLIFWIFSIFALFSAYFHYSGNFFFSKSEKAGKAYGAVWLLFLMAGVLLMKDTKNLFSFFVFYKMWFDFPVSILIPLYIYRKMEREKRRQRENSQKVGKKAKKKVLVSLLALCLFLTGCQNKTDIEDRDYVMTIGIGEGKEKEFSISFETADLSGMSNEKKGSRIFTCEADTLKEAEEMYQQRSDKKQDYGHLKTFLFDAEGMEKETVQRKILLELKKKTEIAGTTLCFFTEEDLLDVMKIGQEKASSFGEYAKKMIENHNGRREDTLSLLIKDQAEAVDKRQILLFGKEKDQLVIEEGVLNLAKRSILTESVLRFHIRAEDDSVESQERKNAVKDRILPQLQQLLGGCESKIQCMKIIKKSDKLIQNWVKEACMAEGSNCQNQVYLCRESFPLKVYGDMIFPSGEYDALRIDLGEGKGANWWCMMYPSLCMTEGIVEKVSEEGKEDLKGSLEEEEYNTLFHRMEKKYEIRWKWKEWLKNLLE